MAARADLVRSARPPPSARSRPAGAGGAHPGVVEPGVRAAGQRPARRGARPRRAGRRPARAPGRPGPRSTGGGRWRSSCAPRRGGSGPARCGPRSARRPTTSPRRARARRGRRRRPAAGRRAGAPPPTAARRARRPASSARRAAPRPSRRRRGGRRRPPSRRSTSPAGRSRCWRRSCRRTGTAPATRRRGGGRSSSLATSRSGTPPRRISPIVGSAKRAMSRPSVVLPEPVAPTSATCWPAGMCAVTWRSTASSTAAARPAGRVRERDVADVDVERAGRQRRGARAAGGGPTGRSSTPSTRRSPATAVWVWSSTSVNSAIGSRNRYVRKMKPIIAPAVSPLAGPRTTPTTITAGDREDREHLARREQEGADHVGPDLGRRPPLDRRRRPRRRACRRRRRRGSSRRR